MSPKGSCQKSSKGESKWGGGGGYELATYFWGWVLGLKAANCWKQW